jgi:hypothetical protein
MKKFKVTYGIGGYLSTVYEANDEDHAIQLFEEDYPDENGCDDCYELVEHELFNKHLLIEMPDGLTYGIPIEIIARNRAEHYKDEFNGDVAESLREDTIPLFDDFYEVHDWASNNMNWDEVKIHAITLKRKTLDDEFQDAWVNGEWKVA